MPRPAPPPPPAPRLPRSIDRGNVSAIVERCREELATQPARAVRVDCQDVDEPRLPTVDVIARLALAARRDRRELHLEHAGPELLELLLLCGLIEPIQREERRRRA